MSGLKFIAVFLFLIAIGLKMITAREQLRVEPEEGRFYSVKWVIDGDTFRMDDGSEKGVNIRLIGIDAPETRNTGNKTAHPFGEQSKAFLEAMIADSPLRLEYDVRRRDQYNRILAYAFLPDGSHINAEMVRMGYAQIMTVPPNVKYADLFYTLQTEARDAGRGLWIGAE